LISLLFNVSEILTLMTGIQGLNNNSRDGQLNYSI